MDESKEEIISLKLNTNPIIKTQNNKKNNLSPINYINSNFFSKIFYSWANPILSLANKRPLEKDDVCRISKTQSVSYNFEKFKKIFYAKSRNKSSKYPLFISIVILHSKSLLFLFGLNMTDVGLEYIRIYFFKKIISIFSDGDFFPTHVFSLYNISHFKYKFNIIESIIIFILIKLIASLLYNYAELESAILNRKIINETSALLMEKLLKTNNNSLGRGEGEKINLVDIDAEKIGFFFFFGAENYHISNKNCDIIIFII